MNEESLLVKFIPSKTCFLQFSNKWLQKVNSSKCKCLRIIHPTSKQELRFTWAPQPSSALNDCSLGINATYANVLNLNENELVVVSNEETIVQLAQVFLVPLSTDDYEILEMSQDIVEESLLNQIRVVNVQQIVTIWISKTVHVKFTVDRILPDTSYGRLEQMTEVIIENTSRSRPLRSSPDSISHPQNCVLKTTENASLWDLLSDFIPFHRPNTEDHAENVVKTPLLLSRVHPLAHSVERVGCTDLPHDPQEHPYNVFVTMDTLLRHSRMRNNTSLQNLLKNKSAIVCQMENVPLKLSKPVKGKVQVDEKTKNNTLDESRKPVGVFVRLYTLEDFCECFGTKRTKIPCVYASQFLMKVLNVKVCDKVQLTVFRPSLNKMLTSIALVPSRELSDIEAEELVQQFSTWLPSREGVLVNNLCPLPFNPPVLVRLSPADLLCWPLTRPELEVCPVTVDINPDPDLTPHNDNNELIVKPVTSVFGELVEEGVTAIEFALDLSENRNEGRFSYNILVTGKQGSGKTRLVEAISSHIAGPPHYVHVKKIDCKIIKGKKPETIKKIVSDSLEECRYYSPSLMVLDNLSCIAGSPSGGLEPSPEGGYFLRVASSLRELLWAQRCVCVLATAESRCQVHPQLLSARGRHLFSNFLNITPLLKAQREELLKDMLRDKIGVARQASVMKDVGAKTEGCTARDLRRLVDRALFNFCQNNVITGDFLLCGEDVDAALRGFVPECFSNISLTQRSSVTFTSVGGLDHAKQLLTEALIWPTKYQELFSQCPLRLERGVLLYGAPGTGKTLLASAVAGQSGLNFITVKGPELLSKYIGASEEAVRNLFQKAQSAQPCVLFFDEFDSLAPRRGHDSTGVTDRVVNQLLTQMDGVEALDGVWVIAAASRPDLIDPALLRSGRIGTLVQCPLPTQEERLAILVTLSQKLILASDADLQYVAGQTEGFTGADLQALLVSAQMAAYDLELSDSDDELKTSLPSVDSVLVNQSHLLTALKDTTPSLKPHDRQRFELIYENFQKSRLKGETIVHTPNQRVTLA